MKKKIWYMATSKFKFEHFATSHLFYNYILHKGNKYGTLMKISWHYHYGLSYYAETLEIMSIMS